MARKKEYIGKRCSRELRDNPGAEYADVQREEDCRRGKEVNEYLFSLRGAIKKNLLDFSRDFCRIMDSYQYKVFAKLNCCWHDFFLETTKTNGSLRIFRYEFDARKPNIG